MVSLVSVNVGLPRDVEWQGKTVHTAVWKRAVSGRVIARRLNIDGDGQGDLAGHGGEHRAVMVYQLDSYRYWEKYLERRDFEYGQFGENLTVDGLPDSEVCIGDRYRIGAAVFEVTQPRVTCYRVGMRMNNPEMPSLLVSHKRPGFYFRVIEEGDIGAGDEVVKVADGPERVSVAEVDALLYLPGHPRDRLARALSIPALSTGWKASLETLASAQENSGNVGLAPSLVQHPAWTGFRPLRLGSVHRESIDVLSFTFESQDGSPLPSALPGQFLVFKIQIDSKSDAIMRSYSLSGAPGEGKYRISVKRALGPGSRYFHDQLRVGDVLDVSAPRGSFTLRKGSDPVVLVSAGIGATPLLSMLHSLTVSARLAPREVWWCYGARNGKEHSFGNEVGQLLKALPLSHSWICYSKPEREDEIGSAFDAVGHLGLASLQHLQVPSTADFYLCGPSSFMESLTADLIAWGVHPESIHSETFGGAAPMTPGIATRPMARAHPPFGNGGTGPEVAFTRSNLTALWDGRFGSLLEFAEACDVPVRWSCRVGVCHTCESGLIDGKVRYTPEPLDPPVDGDVLICCCTPSSNIELDL